MIIILLMISFLPLLAGLFLCPVVATNSCKQSKSKIGFCVVQLWPTFNGRNFAPVSTNPFLAWFIPAACWVSLFLRQPDPFLDWAVFVKKCRKCNICYLLGMSFSICGEKIDCRIFDCGFFRNQNSFNNGVLLRAAVYPISITKGLIHYEKSKE